MTRVKTSNYYVKMNIVILLIPEAKYTDIPQQIFTLVRAKYRWFLLIIFFCASILLGCSRQSTDTIIEQYQYDKEGRLILRITPDTSKIKYKYNDQGLLIEIEYPDDHVRYGYEANGNRIWLANKSWRTVRYSVWGKISLDIWPDIGIINRTFCWKNT